jgi:hypothetical protein
MDPIEEFHRHADECRRMARVARDRQVGTRGAAWPRGGCAALRNLKRQKCGKEATRRHNWNTNNSPDQLKVQRNDAKGPAPVRMREPDSGKIVPKFKKCWEPDRVFINWAK